MREEVKELWRFRELLFAMVERELRIRYKNSALGFFWSLLNPLVTVAVMTFVFKYVMQNETENFSAYILAAYLPFIFLQLCLLDAAQSVLIALPVVRKVYFPREIMPLAAVLSNFIHLVLAMVVFLAYLFVLWAVTGFQDSPFTWRLLFLPVLLIVNLVFAAGLSLLISAYNVFYEDVKYVVSVGLYLAFFLTPIMYFSETVYFALKKFGETGQWLYTAYHLNPVAMLSTAYRKTLVPPGKIKVVENGQMIDISPLAFNWTLFLICVGLSVLTLLVGYSVFNRLKWKFVERP